MESFYMYVYNSAVLTAHSCILIIGSPYLVTAEDIIGDGREIFRTYFKVMRLNIETMKLIMQQAGTFSNSSTFSLWGFNSQLKVE